MNQMAFGGCSPRKTAKIAIAVAPSTATAVHKRNRAAFTDKELGRAGVGDQAGATEGSKKSECLIEESARSSFFFCDSERNEEAARSAIFLPLREGNRLRRILRYAQDDNNRR